MLKLPQATSAKTCCDSMDSTGKTATSEVSMSTTWSAEAHPCAKQRVDLRQLMERILLVSLVATCHPGTVRHAGVVPDSDVVEFVQACGRQLHQ